LMESTRVDPALFGCLRLAPDDRPTLTAWARRPNARLSEVADWVRDQLREEPAHGVLTTVETEVKYCGYIAQQERQVERLRGAERRPIPCGFCYTDIPGLSTEVREKLERVRPETLGQAGRIPGVTPAAIAVHDVYLSLAR